MWRLLEGLNFYAQTDWTRVHLKKCSNISHLSDLKSKTICKECKGALRSAIVKYKEAKATNQSSSSSASSSQSSSAEKKA